MTMRIVRRASVALAALLLWPLAAVGQQPLAAFRPSSVQTPRVTDTDVIRQRSVDLAGGLSASTLATTPVLQLDLFADVSLRAVRERGAVTRNGATWVGTLDGYPESDAVFVFSRGELIGHLHTPFGFFRVQQDRQGGYLVQQVDQRTAGREVDDAVPADEAPPEAAAPRAARLHADNGSFIDLMVVFTSGAAAGAGGETRALSLAEMLVTETSRALQRSNIRTVIRLVHTAFAEYEETADSSKDLQALTARTDGILDQVHSLRDAHGADLVVLITERMTDACGRGFLNSTRSLSGSGFSVVRRSCTGNGRTFAHEVGHNLGLQHDWYATASGGAFPYSKGHVSLSGRFLDIMAYFDLCTATSTSCAAMLQYANPAITRDGHPTGVPQGTSTACVAGARPEVHCDADAAATLPAMAPVVARFRNSVTPYVPRVLYPNDAITSTNGVYRLLYQGDGNLVLYNETTRIGLWSSDTAGISAGRAEIRDDGNFVVLDAEGVVRWETLTAGNPGATLAVQNDGNVVVYRSDGLPLWHRFR